MLTFIGGGHEAPPMRRSVIFEKSHFELLYDMNNVLPKIVIRRSTDIVIEEKA